MKQTFLLCLGLIAAFSTQAGEPDYRSYFSYPDAQLSIKIGTSHSEAVPSKNHTIPKVANEVTVFSSGLGLDDSVKRPDSPSVHWRFIQKTEYGDLYLIDVKKQETLIRALPVLYTGSSLVAYDYGDIRVVIEPLRPDAQ